MWRNAIAALGIVAVSAATAIWVAAPPEPGGTPDPLATSHAAALRSFDACDELTGWLARHAEPYIGPWGFQGGWGGPGLEVAVDATMGAADEASAPAPSARAGQTPAYSGTNVQEAGVDEPDTVKTDGQRLFTVRDGQLLHVDLTGAEPRVAGSAPAADVSNGSAPPELLLSGDRLLVTWHAWDQEVVWRDGPGGDAALSMPMSALGTTRAQLFDVSGDEPVLLGSARFDGDLVAARLHGDTARLVLRNQPVRVPLVQPRSGEPADLEAARRANVRAVREAAPAQWLPWMSVTDETGATPITSERPLTRCEDVHHTGDFAGFGTLDVLTVPLGGSLEDIDATSVLTGAETVYASPEHLVVTTYRWPEPQPAAITDRAIAPGGPAPGAPAPVDPASFTTALHAFDVSDPGSTVYVGSGEVPGHVLNQFSLSEHDGHLRVATTVGAPWAGGSESGVHVLRFDDGALTEVGRIGELGLGERIYAVRYVGDVGYVVTFRQVDPLYVLDLSDPTDPELSGELKIPGYSAYLHPVDDGLLLGVGQDATDQGRTLGTQVALFDVRDPGDPKQVAKTVISESNSQAEFDHHAFLYWPATGLTVIPVATWGRLPWAGAFAFEVDGTTLTRIGELSHEDHVDGAPRDPWVVAERGAISRSLVVGDRLLTLSDAGLLTSALDDLGSLHWLALRSG